MAAVLAKTIKLTAEDGHRLDAYVAEPKGRPRGSLVVVQEIFGVTGHIQRTALSYAAQGYKAIAPAMFDRIKPGINLPYTDIKTGIAYMQQLEWPNTLADIDAAADAVRDSGMVAIVGDRLGRHGRARGGQRARFRRGRGLLRWRHRPAAQ